MYFCIQFDLVEGVIVQDDVLELVLLVDVDGELAIDVNNKNNTKLIDIGFIVFKAFRSEEPGHEQC